MTQVNQDSDAEYIVAGLRELIHRILEEKQQNVDVVETITLETHLLSLPLDSLGLIELMSGIENEFNVYISDTKAYEFQTVADVVSYIQEKQAAKAARAAAKAAQ